MASLYSSSYWTGWDLETAMDGVAGNAVHEMIPRGVYTANLKLEVVKAPLCGLHEMCNASISVVPGTRKSEVQNFYRKIVSHYTKLF